MKYELDDIDRVLVTELQENARVSNVVLARKVNLTEGAVRKRVDNLLKSKVLRLMGVSDPQYLGLTLDIKKVDVVINELVAMPQFSFVYQALGEFDVLGVAFFTSNAELGEFITGVLAQVDGIISVQTFLILNTPKRHFVFGVPSVPEE